MKTRTLEDKKAIAAKSFATRRRNKEEADKLRDNAVLYRDGLYNTMRILEANRGCLERMELFVTIGAPLIKLVHGAK
jgi:hypothetical protein